MIERIKEYFTIDFPIEPTSWSRAGHNKKTGVIFKKTKMRKYQEQLKQIAKTKIKKPLADPLEVVLIFGIKRPKTVKREFPSVVPDIDNLCKAIMDGLNKVVWEDDALIVSLKTIKVYKDEPSIRLAVRTMSDLDEWFRLS